MRIRETRFDWERQSRTGLPEAVLCEGKSADQIAATLRQAKERGTPLLLTRLGKKLHAGLSAFALDYDPISKTAIFDHLPKVDPTLGSVGIVAAGTSDIPVSREALRTLGFLGVSAEIYTDIGVAGLWRLMEEIPAIRRHEVLIAVAGMEGALFSVLSGLVRAPVVAVPTSNGYGVATGGRVALDAALASCAPGITVVNIDNGFGAACAARRILGLGRAPAQAG
jgi:NCAIR mutase (PurE)-related protein